MYEGIRKEAFELLRQRMINYLEELIVYVRSNLIFIILYYIILIKLKIIIKKNKTDLSHKFIRMSL